MIIMLEILNKEKLNDEEKEFITLHNKILVAAQLTGVHLYEFCKELKEMRDSKKYIYAGLNNFEEYAIDVLGLKKSQAYNFCSIAENVSSEIFQSIGKIGSTKLLLISKLQPDEQEKVIDEIDLKKTTVKELQNKIEKLKAGNTSLQKSYDILQKDYNDLDAKIKELENNPKIIEKEIIKEDLTKDNKIKELELKVKGLESNINSSLNQFKIIFDVIKDNIAKAINIALSFENDDKNKCLNALKKLIELI